MDIGERLFSLRQERGQSLQQVADEVGVSKAHVWELEKGRSKNPSFDLVRKMAVHFGVSMDVLVGAESAPGSDAQQIERIHRSLGALSDRDRGIIEGMVRTMTRTPQNEA